jgi:hypothetical protein
MPHPTPEEQQAIDIALSNGNKIQAIKIHRGATGGDLSESKEAVEARLSELQKLHPGRYVRKSSGCLGLAAVLISLSALAGVIVWRCLPA